MKLDDLRKLIFVNNKPISIGHLSETLNAKARPSYSTGKQIAKALGIELDIIMEGTAEEIQAAIKEAV